MCGLPLQPGRDGRLAICSTRSVFLIRNIRSRLVVQIEWYNKGGVVVDPDDEPVDSIHPYQRDLIEFIERPSEYSMPAAKAKKTALKSPKKGVKQKK